MKVVIVIDSFKGSMSSMDAGCTIRDAVLKVRPDAEVIVKPLADGGEGTTDAFIDGMGGKRVDLTVTGPMGSPVEAYYGYLEATQTAIMEMASAAGITLVPDNEKNPMLATTYGVGEMIYHAAQMGARHFLVGIGGSATNDCGLGMLKALGYKFFDANGNDVGEGAQALERITVIDDSEVYSVLKECTFRIACDVNNPLCGSNGATYIFGPQKGVTEELKEPVDRAMAHFAAVSEKAFGVHCQEAPGAGAAGGLGFAFLSYLNGKLEPGIDLVLDAVGLKHELEDADVVVTGEGRMDHQTAMGKAPVGVAKLAKAHNANVKVIAFAGSVTKEAGICNDAGIDAFFPILRCITTLEEAMVPANARQNLFETAEQVFRII